jgi:hypothetical protein
MATDCCTFDRWQIMLVSEGLFSAVFVLYPRLLVQHVTFTNTICK